MLSDQVIAKAGNVVRSRISSSGADGGGKDLIEVEIEAGPDGIAEAEVPMVQSSALDYALKRTSTPLPGGNFDASVTFYVGTLERYGKGTIAVNNANADVALASLATNAAARANGPVVFRIQPSVGVDVALIAGRRFLFTLSLAVARRTHAT